MWVGPDPPPALLTRRSKVISLYFSKKPSIALESVMSRMYDSTLSDTRSETLDRSLETAITLYPFWDRCLTVASPTPLLAPVTIAVFINITCLVVVAYCYESSDLEPCI